MSGKDSPRIDPVRGKADVPPAAAGVVDRVEGFFGRIRGPFSVMLHSPVLAAETLDLVERLRDSTIVDDRSRALAILATVRERDCNYVWSAQAGYARRVGLRDEAIATIAAKGDTAGLTEQERQIVDYARELARTNRVPADKFDALLERYGKQWLVEITAAAHFYAFLSGVANAFDVPVPDDGERFA